MPTRTDVQVPEEPLDPRSAVILRRSATGSSIGAETCVTREPALASLWVLLSLTSTLMWYSHVSLSRVRRLLALLTFHISRKRRRTNVSPGSHKTAGSTSVRLHVRQCCVPPPSSTILTCKQSALFHSLQEIPSPKRLPCDPTRTLIIILHFRNFAQFHCPCRSRSDT